MCKVTNGECQFVDNACSLKCPILEAFKDKETSES